MPDEGSKLEPRLAVPAPAPEEDGDKELTAPEKVSSESDVSVEEPRDVDRSLGSPDEYVPAHVLDGGRDFRVEGNDVSGYIGVDPEYQTYANPGDKPYLTDTERFLYTDQYDHLEGNADAEIEAEAGETEGPEVTE
jgi:hypothetical protein